MVVSAILSLFGLGFLCWVLFSLAVYALPVFVAVTVGHYAYVSDAGVFGAVILAFVAGAAALVAGQIAFATIRSVPVRLALGALYAGPAGLAGFYAVKGLSQTGGAGESWTMVFASIGALVIGVTAWARVAALSGPADDVSDGSDAFPVG